MKGWVLVDRRGAKPVLVQGTYGLTRWDVWDGAFDFVCNKLGLEWKKTFPYPLWSSDAYRSARKHGFHIERAEVVLIPKAQK